MFAEPKISAFATKDEMIAYFVRLATGIAQKAVLDRGFAAIALSGGSTPEPFYTALAHQSDFPWSAANFFMVDERFVPAGHKDNNFVMVERAFSGSPVDRQRLHPVATELESAAAAARNYDKRLREFFAVTEDFAQRAKENGHPAGGGNMIGTKDKGEALPRFDLIMLGMGKDGHTASLFPGTGATGIEGPLAIAVKPLEAPHERISLTLSVLNAARHCVFLMSGADKRDMYARVRAGRDEAFPASLVQPRDGQLEFLVSDDVLS